MAFLGSLIAVWAWTLLSATWSASAAPPILEAERTVVYVAGCLAALLLLRSHRPLVVGTWAAISAVCAYSLSTRLFPTRLGAFDSIAGYRLSEPLGYWNGLGLFAAMGSLLAVGLVLRATTPALRIAAGASSVALTMTLYFTFSRGAWISLAAGFLAMLALERRRLLLLAAVLAVAPWSAAGIWIASQSEALTRLQASLSAAAADGRRLALVLIGLALAAGATAFAFASLEKRFRPPRLVRLAFGGALVVATAASLIAVSVWQGPPPTLARKAYDSFVTPAPFEGQDLNQRLLRVSAGQRIPQWRVAWRQYRENPWLGSGAGTYEAYWVRHRPSGAAAKDAHNLYLERLAELGPVGLGLLLLALAVPLGAAVRARERGLVAATCGAYVAYLVDAAGEWNWELPAITLAALFTASALVMAAREQDGVGRKLLSPRPAAFTVALALALALASFAFVGLVGNSALRESADAVHDLEVDRAESQARKAARWMPWSSEPWQRLADVERYRGDLAATRRNLRRAIAKAPESWEPWYRLALASSGDDQRRALEVASHLNPLSPEVAALESLLAEGPDRAAAPEQQDGGP